MVPHVWRGQTRVATIFVSVLSWTASGRLSTISTPVPVASPLAVVDAAVVRLRVDQPDAGFTRAFAADFDGDGDADVVASSALWEATLWENDGDGHFARRAAFRASSIAAGDPGVATSSPADSQPGAPPTVKWWSVLDRRSPIVAPAADGQLSSPGSARRAVELPVSEKSPRGPPSSQGELTGLPRDHFSRGENDAAGTRRVSVSMQSVFRRSI
jgi:hypothetical protein